MTQPLVVLLVATRTVALRSLRSDRHPWGRSSTAFRSLPRARRDGLATHQVRGSWAVAVADRRSEGFTAAGSAVVTCSVHMPPTLNGAAGSTPTCSD